MSEYKEKKRRNLERVYTLKNKIDNCIYYGGVEGFNNNKCGHEMLLDWLQETINILQETIIESGD